MSKRLYEDFLGESRISEMKASEINELWEKEKAVLGLTMLLWVLVFVNFVLFVALVLWTNKFTTFLFIVTFIPTIFLIVVGRKMTKEYKKKLETYKGDDKS